MFGAAWQRFADVTSNVPFAAILAGRNRLGLALREIGLLRPAVAIVFYAAFFVLHGRFFGVALG